jgi:hypothetical protein
MTEPRRSGEPNPVPLERETAPLARVSSSSKVAARVFVPRNWSRSPSRGLRHRAGRLGFQKAGPALSERQVEASDQGEEPPASGDGQEHKREQQAAWGRIGGHFDKVRLSDAYFFMDLGRS